MAIDITAVHSEGGGRVHGSVMAEQVQYDDVSSLIERVVEAAGNLPIRTLAIVDSGDPTGASLGIGSDKVSMAAIGQFEALFSQLRGSFCPGGSVHLQNPFAGRNERLLERLATIIGVPVIAGTGLKLGSGAGMKRGEAYKKVEPMGRATFKGISKPEGGAARRALGHTSN